MVHEANYPVRLDQRGICIGLPHYLQFLFLAIAANQVFFAHQALMEAFAFFRYKSSVLPVVSNIPVLRAGSAKATRSVDAGTPAKVRAEAGVVNRLVYFGGNHPTIDLPLVFQAFRYIQQRGKTDSCLLLIGLHADEVDDRLYEGLPVEFLGRLSADEVSRELQRATVVLLPFLDGVSTRRGSFMAALAHGCAVVTTSGRNTDPLIPFHDFCLISAAEARPFFQDNALALLDDSWAREQLGNKARQYYDEHFSVAALWRKLQRFI